MKQCKILLAATFLFFCHLGAEAAVTATATDTPVSTAQGAGGSPLTSTISFPVSGTITDATVDLAINVGQCGAGAVTLTGPGGTVTMFIAVNSEAGDIFAMVTDTGPATCHGDCGAGCGLAGSPAPCRPLPESPMSNFDGETSDATDWTMAIETFGAPGCGPWTINSWSLTLDGVSPPQPEPKPLPFRLIHLLLKEE